MKITLHAILFLLFPALLMAQDPTRFQEKINEWTTQEALSLNKDCDYLFVGSSSIEGWENLDTCFPEKHVVNHGFGGSQMSDLLYYLQDIVIAFDPGVIFIYEGDNDIGSGEKPSSVMRETIILISMLQRELPGTPIFMISPKPCPAKWGRHKAFERYNRHLEKYCRMHEGIHFIDVWTPVFTADGKLRDDIFREDRVHLNESGYKIWYACVSQAIKANL